MMQLYIGLVALVCFLFSLGTGSPVRALLYHVLPLMDIFRHPSTMRIFTSGAILLLAGFGMEQYFSGKETVRSLKKIIFCVIAGICLFVIGKVLIDGDSAHFTLSRWTGADTVSIKDLIGQSTVYEWLIITGIIQVLFLFALIKMKTRGQVLLVAVFNLLVFVFLSMPFTMVSQRSSREINAFVNAFPSGFPMEKAWEPLNENWKKPSLVTAPGYIPFYNKNISLQDHVITPTINKNYGALLWNQAFIDSLAGKTFAYVDSPGAIRLTGFSPNAFSFETELISGGWLHITQQFHHRWKAFINGHEVKIEKDHVALMKIPLSAGKNLMSMKYDHGNIGILAIVSASLFLICAGIAFYLKIRS
jgi:hypothetical protein